ncbi:MAG: MFS transporter [Dehalococcoidia bacterium]
MANSPSRPSESPSPADEGAEADSQAHLVPAWAPFTFADYRVFWFGSVAAMFTQQLIVLVTSIALFETTRSATDLGILGFIRLAVQIPGLLWGGTLADEMDRKRLMAVTQGVTAAALALLAVLAMSGALAAWHIFLVTGVLSASTVLGQPARNALTAVVVPRTHLLHAVTANTFTQQIGSIVAPLTFALVWSVWGLNAAILVTALTAVPSALLPLLIRASGRPVGVTVTGSMPRRVIEGFQYVRGHGILPGLFILDIGMTVFTFYRDLLPALASGLFGGGAVEVSWLTSSNSVGAVVGAAAVVFTARYRAKGMLVVYVTLAFSVFVFLFGTVPSFWLGMVVIFGMGAMDAVSMTTRQAMMQLTTPDQMLGRTLSLGSLVATTANNVGTMWVGFLAGGIALGGVEFGGLGEARTMQLGGILALACTFVVWWAMKGVRDYRYP